MNDKIILVGVSFEITMPIQTQIFYFEDSRLNKKERPAEDFSLVRENIFAVFDGVTLLFQDPYPNPSPARIVSEIAANEVIKFIQEHTRKDFSGNKLDLIKEAFIKANREIKRFNEGCGITPKTVDHLARQFAATVGAFGFFDEEILYFGQINDSGVMVFDSLGNREVDLVYNGSTLVSLLSSLEKSGRFKPGSREEHVFVRSQIVNNPGFGHSGIKVNFVVANGEEQAARFLKFGACNLTQGQIALFYTDGFLPFVYDSDFIKVIFSTADKAKITDYINGRVESAEELQKEKSLVVVRYN